MKYNNKNKLGVTYEGGGGFHRLAFFSFLLLAAIFVPCFDAYSRNIMVIAPHPDDETLIASGVINKAVMNGDDVKVVIVTNGDAGGEVPSVSLGYVRQVESVSAMSILGLEESDVIFMGYPDGSMMEIYDSGPDVIITSLAGQTKTYGNRGLGNRDYHTYRYGIPGNYKKLNVLEDIKNLILSYNPDDIYLASQYDSHPDHRAIYLFVVGALQQMQAQGQGSQLKLHETLVHPPCAGCSPWPAEGFTPTQLHTEPAYLHQTPLDWNLIESLIVPVSMQSENPNSNLKLLAIHQYQTQLNAYPDFSWDSYAKLNEFFWVSNYSASKNIAPFASSINVSSENADTDQIGAKAIDGFVDGAPQAYMKEWATISGGAGSFIQLNWFAPYIIDQVSLFDRPNTDDHVLSGTLFFSDGTSIPVNALTNSPGFAPNAPVGYEVVFSPKTVNWVRFTVDSVSAQTLNVGLAEIMVYGYKPAQEIPAVIQVEDFDDGGEGIAYHDEDAGNMGGVYRSTDVDIEASSDVDGGFDVARTKAGEWLNYSISVPHSGSYYFNVRMASEGSGGRYHLEIDGANITGAMMVPDTGGWQVWQTVAISNISLGAGPHVLRLVMDADGATGGVGNFNWIRISDRPAPFNFSLTGSDYARLVAGKSESTIIKARMESGTSQMVSFSVSGLPAGVTGTFSQGTCAPTCYTTLTFTAANSAVAGAYPIAVTATSGSLKRTASLILFVTAPPRFDFSLFGPIIEIMAAGTSDSMTIKAWLKSGTAQAVKFSVSDLPAGVVGTFSQETCLPTCSTTLKLAASKSTRAGVHIVTVTADSGSLQRETRFILIVSKR